MGKVGSVGLMIISVAADSPSPDSQREVVGELGGWELGG